MVVSITSPPFSSHTCSLDLGRRISLFVIGEILLRATRRTCPLCDF